MDLKGTQTFNLHVLLKHSIWTLLTVHNKCLSRRIATELPDMKQYDGLSTLYFLIPKLRAQAGTADQRTSSSWRTGPEDAKNVHSTGALPTAPSPFPTLTGDLFHSSFCRVNPFPLEILLLGQEILEKECDSVINLSILRYLSSHFYQYL